MTNFEEIYQEYATVVYRYLLSLGQNPALAEELTQETFLKALEHLPRFEGKCKLSVWLCQIAKHLFLSQLRKEKHCVSGDGLAHLGTSEGVEAGFLQRESALAIHRALHHLAEPYKEVFSLRLFGELSYADIADLFGKTESWARVTYHRARLKLKEEMQCR